MATLLMRCSRPCARRFGMRVPLTQRLASTLPEVVRPSRAEVSAGRLDARNLEKAIRSLHNDGLVVVADAIPHDELDHLNKKMIEDARHLQSLGDKGPYNYNKGNLQQDPPPVRDFFSKAIFTNPLATQVTTNMLGPRPQWTFCSGNTAVKAPTPERQPVHSDADFAHPDHPFALVVNIPLISFTPENGSTEIWLGTHTKELAGLHVQDGLHGERASGRIKEHLLEERRKVRPPSQPIIEKGSIVIRDLRLWHAGMPNMTADVRVMLALIHFAPWYRNQMRLVLADDLKATVESQQDLGIPVDWISREHAMESYLKRGFGNSYDFDQTA